MLKLDDIELEELLEVLMLEADVPYENTGFSFDIAKKLVVQSTLDLVEGVINNSDLSERDKMMTLATSISYLNLENFYLRIQREYKENTNRMPDAI